MLDKNNLQVTEISTEIISAAATASNSKIIDIEMEPASSPISGYQLIDMSILADAFILLSCPGCHGIQRLKRHHLLEWSCNSHIY